MGKIFLPDDPRICTKSCVSVSECGPAVMVVLLLARAGSDDDLAVLASTPAETRGLALRLFDAAKEADRVMNEALQKKEGI